jgi:sec-independent protein translocase protein TatC
MPLALTFFMSMEQTTGDVQIVLEARVSEYLSLIMTLIIGFGICFQLPVVLSILARAGIIDGQNLRDFRRYAIIAITAVAAVLSPPDPFSMIAMMLPTILLYEASILIVDWITRTQIAPEKPTSS